MNGKRSGRWKEYYPGTAILCRTEHWRNDLLNGVRTRYDKNGKIIETILFKDGEVKNQLVGNLPKDAIENSVKDIL